MKVCKLIYIFHCFQKMNISISIYIKHVISINSVYIVHDDIQIFQAKDLSSILCEQLLWRFPPGGFCGYPVNQRATIPAIELVELNYTCTFVLSEDCTVNNESRFVCCLIKCYTATCNSKAYMIEKIIHHKVIIWFLFCHYKILDLVLNSYQGQGFI